MLKAYCCAQIRCHSALPCQRTVALSWANTLSEHQKMYTENARGIFKLLCANTRSQEYRLATHTLSPTHTHTLNHYDTRRELVAEKRLIKLMPCGAEKMAADVLKTSAEYSLFYRALLQKRPIILRSISRLTDAREKPAVSLIKFTTHKSIWIKQARGTLDLPQTSRANPVQCYSTHQEKPAVSLFQNT